MFRKAQNSGLLQGSLINLNLPCKKNRKFFIDKVLSLIELLKHLLIEQ